MFNLATIRDTVRIEPSRFGLGRVEALTQEINEKLANKVIDKVGVCICLYDILEIGDACIVPGDGGAHYRVLFRLLVLCPVQNEIMIGQLQDVNSERIKVALPGLFSCINIGHEGLSPSYKQLPSGFAYQTPGPERRTLQLTYPVSSSSRAAKDKASGEAAKEDHSFAFKVLRVTFSDKVQDEAAGSANVQPMSIEGRVDEASLGMLHWFNFLG